VDSKRDARATPKLKIENAVVALLQSAGDTAALDVVEFFRQLVCREPRDVYRLLVPDLRLARDIAAAETHGDELTTITVRVHHVWIGPEQREPFHFSGDSGLLKELAKDRGGRMLRGLYDSRWQAPPSGVAASRQQQMHPAWFEIVTEHDR
jgi:hypothetical protein